jgi:hypothetical protein
MMIESVAKHEKVGGVCYAMLIRDKSRAILLTTASKMHACLLVRTL